MPQTLGIPRSSSSGSADPSDKPDQDIADAMNAAIKVLAKRKPWQDHRSGPGLPSVERVTGIEPALSAWEADVLPLNYTRRRHHCT